MVEGVDQIGTAGGAVNVFFNADENLFDLGIEFGAIGNQQDAGVGDVFADPFGEPDHGQAFAGALGVPDDAPFAALDVLLGGMDAEVLVVAAGLFGARIEDGEVVDEFEEAGFVTEQAEVFVEGAIAGGGGGFFPLQVILFWGFDGAVAQSLGIVPGHQELQGGEEGTDEGFLLIIEVLADAFPDGDAGAFEFQDTEGDAVNVNNKIGAFFVFAFDGDFFGEGKVIIFRIFPVNQPNGLVMLACAFFIFYAVAQQSINGFVGIVEVSAFAEGGGLVELAEGFGDQDIVDALLAKPLAEEFGFDVAVVGTVFPVAEVAIAQLF